MLLMTSLAVVGLAALITSQPSVEIRLWDGEAETTAQVVARTVEQALATLTVPLQPGDLVEPALDATLSADTRIQITRSREVTLILDGQARTLRTLFTTPQDILAEAAVQPGPLDRVWVDGALASPLDLIAWPIPASRIEVRRAVEVIIVDDGLAQTLQTASATVADALTEAGIVLAEADQLTPDEATPLTAGLRVQITRAAPIAIIVDGQTLETPSRAGVIGDALQQAGVTLGDLDYSVPSAQVPVYPGLVVRVIRVIETMETFDEVIPFEVIYQADSNRELDQVVTLQAGQAGSQRLFTRVRFENGVEVSRTPDRTEVIAQPVDQVIAYGTNVVIRVVDTPDGPREYWRVMRLYATSYHPAALGGDNVTATGRILTKGIVGIDPTVIPYGTQMYVPGYGLALAADTGIRRRKLWIDLGYDDANWVSWSRYIDVYILTPVPPEIDYILPER
jgi:uncharacterized protein YabE (DUF348 family)